MESIKKSKLSFLALLAAVVIFLIYLSAEVLAVEGDDLYTYRVEGDNAIICRFYSEAAAITVPDSVDGLGVTAIDPEAFNQCPNLRYLTLPDTINYLPDDLLPQAITVYSEDNAYVANYCQANNLTYKEAATISALSSVTFTDVKSNHWAIDYITDLAGKGVIEGYGDGTFRPENSISRAEFVKMLAVASKDDLSAFNGIANFTDVDKNQWYAPSVAWAESKQIVKGYEDGRFKPEQKISRQEMMVVQNRFAQYVAAEPLPIIVSEMIFADSSEIGSWAAEDVKVLQMTGVINGKEQNALEPQGYSTRAEVTTMVSRFLTLLETDNSSNIIKGFTYIPQEKIYWRDGLVVNGTNDASLVNQHLISALAPYCQYHNAQVTENNGVVTVTLSSGAWFQLTIGSNQVKTDSGSDITLAASVNRQGNELMVDITALATLFGDEARISADGTAVFVYPQGRSVNEANWLKGYTSYVYNKEHAVTSHTANYGQSGQGRNLSYTVVGPSNYTKTIMLVFEQHGFEDSYARDGQVLVDTAKRLISHYQQAKVSEFNQSRFVIVSSANPDGLAEGYTNNGPGRCTIVGKVDMNRDWPTSTYQRSTQARYYTLSPLSCRETQNLRNLITNIQPDVLLDCHGWLNGVYGDRTLADIFNRQMGLPKKSLFSSSGLRATDVTNLSAVEADAAYLSGLVGFSGYLSGYGYEQGIRSALVEFPSPTGINFNKFLQSLTAISKL